MSLPTQYVASHSIPALAVGGSLQAVNPPSSSGPTFREYLRVLRRHWRIVLLPLLIALLATSLAMLLMTPMYTARCTIMIERQAPQILTIKQPVAENADAAEEHDFYATQYELLASRSLAAQVIEKLKLAKDPYFLKLVGKLRSIHKQTLEASSKPADQYESLTFTPSRQTAVGSRLIDAYLAQLMIEP
ncbi:MAG TPA: Wzz/FepE/Etk N-terminal domain-containing protein, partial [Bryobacteraceae bacterium]|nr:Wzz/FepE/Etk N-terminal domain-containing protein [Bryobacteraceae bacterium]